MRSSSSPARSRRAALGAAAALGLSALAASGAWAGDAWVAELEVRELGYRSTLRVRVFHEPDWIPIPAGTGRLVLLAADGAAGERTFFIPTDLAFEAGPREYRVEFERVSDLWGQPLGGRLRPGETMLGFAVLPAELELERFFPGSPDSVQIRYAHHRAAFRAATGEERAAWEGLVEKPRLLAGLNAWWAWVEASAGAPPMSEGEAALFAERLFPGQGPVLAREGIDPDALRNAILRVGERRLLSTPAVQRVAPAYPAAARQLGAAGLVVVLAYLSPEGTVEDATIFASNTIHLLHAASLAAAIEWRFMSRPAGGEGGDGWRLLPFQFKLEEGETVAPADTAGMPLEPPRILKYVRPEYPEKAYRARIEGTVVYRVRIDARGKLVAATLVTGVHPLLDDAALAAVERMLFAPATRGAVPVEGEIEIPFTFPEPKR